MSGARDGGGAPPNGAASPSGPAPSTTGLNPDTPAGGWEQFRDSIRQLGTDLGGRLDGIRSTVEGSEAGARSRETAAVEAARAAAEASKAPPDYETMSRSELVQHISGTVLERVNKALEGALKPLSERVTAVQNNAASEGGQRQLQDMQAKYKDFGDWRDEMIRIVQTHPTLNLQDAYTLARAGGADKAKQLDEKYNPAPKAQPLWSGLVGALNGDGDPAPQKVDTHEATLDAYKEVSEKYPGVLPLLRGMR